MKLISKIKNRLFYPDIENERFTGIYAEKTNEDGETEVWVPIRKKSKSDIIRENQVKLKRLMAYMVMYTFLLVMVVFNVLVTHICFQRLQDRNNELSAELSSIRSEYSAVSQQNEEEKENAEEAEVTDTDTDSLKKIDKSSVYHGLTYLDLWDNNTHEDEVVSLLSGIVKIYYGTAGCSLQMMARGADLAYIAEKSEKEWSGISAYLDTLTAAQLDYLSFRLFETYDYALSAVRGDWSITDELERMGVPSDTYSSCSERQLIKFMGYMLELFDEKGVEYEWETYDVMTVFR